MLPSIVRIFQQLGEEGFPHLQTWIPEPPVQRKPGLQYQSRDWTNLSQDDKMLCYRGLEWNGENRTASKMTTINPHTLIQNRRVGWRLDCLFLGGVEKLAWAVPRTRQDIPSMVSIPALTSESSASNRTFIRSVLSTSHCGSVFVLIFPSVGDHSSIPQWKCLGSIVRVQKTNQMVWLQTKVLCAYCQMEVGIMHWWLGTCKYISFIFTEARKSSWWRDVFFF